VRAGAACVQGPRRPHGRPRLPADRVAGDSLYAKSALGAAKSSELAAVGALCRAQSVFCVFFCLHGSGRPRLPADRVATRALQRPSICGLWALHRLARRPGSEVWYAGILGEGLLHWYNWHTVPCEAAGRRRFSVTSNVIIIYNFRFSVL